jgi:hypothetical protein
MIPRMNFIELQYKFLFFFAEGKVERNLIDIFLSSRVVNRPYLLSFPILSPKMCPPLSLQKSAANFH